MQRKVAFAKFMPEELCNRKYRDLEGGACVAPVVSVSASVGYKGSAWQICCTVLMCFITLQI